ncbi:MAG: DevR family CRISPR-associated autoregulator [Syntrophaceae bacterium]|nr:DevR family CRISPR-associated autoregulator [Syntrophaceae bacterium]
MAIFEIGILGRVTWNLHSMNNEGTVGNVTEPRTVVLADGEKTDGISGEMLKHIHAYNVWLLQEDKGQFCQACQKFHPQKADMNPLIQGKDTPEKAMETAISSCILCDLHGFLVQRPAVARPSTVEFGWTLGLPEKTHREIHIHARHSMVGRSREEAEEKQAGEETVERQVPAQMIYHRPTRSGVYAIVSVFQPWRIGLNEVDYTYTIDDEKRKNRYQLAMNAYKATFMRTDGAMTSTRFPHVEAMEGVVVTSETNFPVPTISPLKDGFVEEMESLVTKQRGLSHQKFSNLAELCDIINALANKDIFRLGMPGAK